MKSSKVRLPVIASEEARHWFAPEASSHILKKPRCETTFENESIVPGVSRVTFERFLVQFFYFVLGRCLASIPGSPDVLGRGFRTDRFGQISNLARFGQVFTKPGPNRAKTR